MRSAILFCESVLINSNIASFVNKYFINLEVSKNGCHYPFMQLDKAELTTDISNKNNIFKTSLPNLQSIKNIVRKLDFLYDHVYVVLPSRQFSGTFQMVYLEVRDNPKFIVIDTHAIAIDENLVGNYLVDRLNNGDLVSQVDIDNYLKKVSGVVVPYDLDYLKRSGKISNLKSVLLSKIGVSLGVHIDHLKVPNKIIGRGDKNILRKIDGILTKKKVAKIVLVHHGLEPNELDKVLILLRKHCDIVEVHDLLSFSVLVHFGPKLFSIGVLDA